MKICGMKVIDKILTKEALNVLLQNNRVKSFWLDDSND